ncbi:MAG: TIGR02234 family membrane protein [Jatrophihabitans sp.]|nr:MAG: TIGR02234 family membrane protein [Jatrophihabitans sp.]
MTSRMQFALALLADVVGAGGALLIATRPWQQVTLARQHPFGNEVLGLSGRTLDAAPTALALVALAGVVAVLATKGVWRRQVGAIVALAGAGLVWRSLDGLAVLSDGGARPLLPQARGDAGAIVSVTVNPAWPALSAACGALVLVAGLAVAVRGHRWAGMSARYEAPVNPDEAAARANASLWQALDRGDDPTG